MKQKDKDLLLKDLCTRLSYSVKGTVPVTITLNSYDLDGFHEETEKDFDVELISINIDGVIEVEAVDDKISDTIFYQQQAEPWTIEEFTPYLRPMSSMTEEEIRDFPFPYYFDWIDSNFSLLCSNDEVCASIGFDEMYEIMDWLNKKMFDYRGLIEKGLAIEAPEGMYNLNEK